MSHLDRHRPDPENISSLVRGGHASRSDGRDLQRALERDPTLRVAHQVGLELDRDTSVRAGDEDVILRAADAALARAEARQPKMAPAPRTTRSRSWQMVAAMVAMAVLSCTGIGAALWVAGVTPWRAPEKASGPTRSQRQPRRHLAPPQRAEPQRSTLQPEVVAAPTQQVPAELPVRVRHSPGADAAALFQAANTARRAGEFARAKHLYADLIRKAPAADEAHLAHVSLGKLLLAQGQFAAAEREFHRYLTAGGGPLSEEALFNRAQCLFRLGRPSDERQAWRALLSAYPDSLYAAQAKERLAAMNASPGSTP